jgi:hypothetical protein
MTYVEDEGLRRQMWEASAALGSSGAHDNTPLIGRILTLRAEKAALLGKPHFADLVLERRMAKNGAAAWAFLDGFAGPRRGGFRAGGPRAGGVPCGGNRRGAAPFGALGCGALGGADAQGAARVRPGSAAAVFPDRSRDCGTF